MKYGNQFPRFEHDCVGCRYLGENRNCDLYYCLYRHKLIARYGNGSHDFWAATPALAHDHALKVLRVARQRAVDAEILWPDSI